MGRQHEVRAGCAAAHGTATNKGSGWSTSNQRDEIGREIPAGAAQPGHRGGVRVLICLGGEEAAPEQSGGAAQPRRSRSSLLRTPQAQHKLQDRGEVGLGRKEQM